MAVTLSKILNIELDEKSRVFSFLVQSVFIGIFFGALDVAAHALFLDVYPATFIPKAYIVSGLAGIILTTLYTRMQQKYEFGRFAGFNLLVIAIVSFLLWAGFWFIPNKAIVFIIFIFFGPLNILAGLGFWGAVGRMFTLRQGKRIFGLIDSGQIIGIIISSYGATLILSIGYKTKDLLLISAGSIFLALMMQIFISRRFGFKTNSEGNVPVKTSEKVRIRKLLHDPYILFLAIFVGLSVISTFFIHYTFVTVSKENYPDTTSLAKFLGAFTGTMMIASLLVKTFIYGRLIKTYGLKVILLLSPILLAIFTGILLLLGHLAGFSAASSGFILFFLIVSLTKLFSKILRDSVEAPSFKVLYQALGQEIRYSVQSGVDGTINEVAAFSSGLALAGLVSLSFITTIHFVYILGFFLLIWIFSAFRLHREYRESLQSSLFSYQQRSGQDQNIRSLSSYLDELISSGREVSKKFALSIASRIAPSVFEKWSPRKNPSKYDESPETLVYSPDPAHRIACSFHLRGKHNPDGVRLLKILLRDNEYSVREAAINTVGEDNLQELAPIVIENLSHPLVYPWAYAALVKMGEGIIEQLDIYFRKTGLDSKVQHRIIRLLASIGGSQATSLLVTKLGSTNRAIVKETIHALRKLSSGFNEEQRRIIQKSLHEFLSIMAWNIAAHASLMEGERLELLTTVMEEENHQVYEVIMDLLALLYEEKSVMLVKENLESGTREGTGYALELLDLFLADELKRYILPILEDNTLTDKVRLLQEEYPVEKTSLPVLLKAIINRNDNEISTVARLMAIHAITILKQPVLSEDIYAQLFNDNLALAETAALTIASIHENVLESFFIRLAEDGKKELEERIYRIRKEKTQPSILNILTSLRQDSQMSQFGWNDLFLLAEKMKPVFCTQANKNALAEQLSGSNNVVLLVSGSISEKDPNSKPYTWENRFVFTPMNRENESFKELEIEEGSILAILYEKELAELLFDSPHLSILFSSQHSTINPEPIPELT